MNFFSVRSRFWLPAILLALVLPLAAQEAAPVSGEADEDTITFSANRMESVIAKDREKTILIGAAVVNTENMEIKADWIELSGDDYNIIICKGNVIVFDESEGFLLKSQEVEYARDSELGTAKGAVVLEDSRNDVLLKAEWLRFDQVQSTVDARGGVRILKEDFAVRSEFALYNRNDESLQLSGAPVAVSGTERVEADSMSGKAGMDNLEFSGRVSGTITTKKKEGSGP